MSNFSEVVAMSLSVDIAEGLVGFVGKDSDDVGVQVTAHNLKTWQLRKWRSFGNWKVRYGGLTRSGPRVGERK